MSTQLFCGPQGGRLASAATVESPQSWYRQCCVCMSRTDGRAAEAMELLSSILHPRPYRHRHPHTLTLLWPSITQPRELVLPASKTTCCIQHLVAVHVAPQQRILEVKSRNRRSYLCFPIHRVSQAGREVRPHRHVLHSCSVEHVVPSAEGTGRDETRCTGLRKRERGRASVVATLEEDSWRRRAAATSGGPDGSGCVSRCVLAVACRCAAAGVGPLLLGAIFRTPARAGGRVHVRQSRLQRAGGHAGERRVGQVMAGSRRAEPVCPPAEGRGRRAKLKLEY
jgi:hypothetical protein